MVELNKGQTFSWPSVSQGKLYPPDRDLLRLVVVVEWGAVSLGSLDLTLRGAVWSPSNLTADSG